MRSLFLCPNWLILDKKRAFFVFFDKKTPILPKIAKHGLKTNSRPN